MITRRSTFAVFAAALAAPVAAAFAQVGGTATAPSNSEGAPSGGGTGVVGRSQVGPSTPASPPKRRTRRARRTTTPK